MVLHGPASCPSVFMQPFLAKSKTSILIESILIWVKVKTNKLSNASSHLIRKDTRKQKPTMQHCCCCCFHFLCIDWNRSFGVCPISPVARLWNVSISRLLIAYNCSISCCSLVCAPLKFPNGREKKTACSLKIHFSLNYLSGSFGAATAERLSSPYSRFEFAWWLALLS